VILVSENSDLLPALSPRKQGGKNKKKVLKGVSGKLLFFPGLLSLSLGTEKKDLAGRGENSRKKKLKKPQKTVEKRTQKKP